MPKQDNTALKVGVAVAVSFLGLVLTVLVLLGKGMVTFQMALLMLVALLGLYFGFGVLVAVYRFIGRLH